jgi:magnesium chelatase subunit I
MLAEDDSSEEKLITSLIGEAVKNVYANYGELSELQGIVEAFGGGQTTLQIGDEVPGEVLVDSIAGIGDLAERAASLCELLQRDPGDAANLASAAGFILEALYVNNRLSKYVYRGKTYLKR